MMDNNNYVGRQFGNYLALAEIGKGGFARVYRGRHIFIKERVVAIKVLLATSFNSQQERNQFLHEARVLEKLSHSHILPVLDAGLVDEGLPYLVVEYAPHGSLRDRIKQSPYLLPSQEAKTILKQIGEA